MRKSLLLFPLLLMASPALTQPMPQQLPPELTDPRSVQQLSNAAQAISDAMLDINVGEMRAAIQGREPTAAERHVTVRDLARRKDPDFDRHVHQQIAAVGPKIQQSVAAINRGLPAMLQALAQAQQALERAVANMPDPTYPRRQTRFNQPLKLPLECGSSFNFRFVLFPARSG